MPYFESTEQLRDFFKARFCLFGRDSTLRLRCVLGASLVLQLSVAGCGSYEGTSGTPTGASVSSVSGTWTGRASGVETADFTLALTQVGTSVTGTGEVSFPGDQNRFAFDVTGSLPGSTITLTIQLRQRPPISYTGSVDGQAIRGRLNGGNIQHDGPFGDTPLTLDKR